MLRPPRPRVGRITATLEQVNRISTERDDVKDKFGIYAMFETDNLGGSHCFKRRAAQAGVSADREIISSNHCCCNGSERNSVIYSALKDANK